LAYHWGQAPPVRRPGGVIGSMRDVLVILIVVLLVFGSRKLRTIGSDLGEAVKGFRRGVAGRDAPAPSPDPLLPDAEFPEERRGAASHDPHGRA